MARRYIIVYAVGTDWGSADCSCEQGKEGMVIVKTKQALLVAHYPETVQPGQTTFVVEKLADYLIGVGY